MKITSSLLGLAAALGLGNSAMALTTTIDFESTPTGTYTALVYGPVTISFLGGTGEFNVDDATPGAPISHHNVISFFKNPGSDPFQATFAVPVSSVSIGMGDFNADEDEGHLRAYDAANNLLSSDFISIPGHVFGGATLTVSSATPIARVEWNETGSFAGAVYWDNLSYTASGVPDSLGMSGLGLSLSLLALLRRKTS